MCASRAVVICRLPFDDLLVDASAEIAGNVGILYREVFDLPGVRQLVDKKLSRNIAGANRVDGVVKCGSGTDVDQDAVIDRRNSEGLAAEAVEVGEADAVVVNGVVKDDAREILLFLGEFADLDQRVDDGAHGNADQKGGTDGERSPDEDTAGDDADAEDSTESGRISCHSPEHDTDGKRRSSCLGDKQKLSDIFDDVDSRSQQACEIGCSRNDHAALRDVGPRIGDGLLIIGSRWVQVPVTLPFAGRVCAEDLSGGIGCKVHTPGAAANDGSDAEGERWDSGSAHVSAEVRAAVAMEHHRRLASQRGSRNDLLLEGD